MTRILIMAACAAALSIGCGAESDWPFEPGVLVVSFDRSVTTEQEVEAVVAKYSRTELLSVLVYEGGGAYSHVRVPEGREYRFMEKFDAEDTVSSVTPLWLVGG